MLALRHHMPGCSVKHKAVLPGFGASWFLRKLWLAEHHGRVEQTTYHLWIVVLHSIHFFTWFLRTGGIVGREERFSNNCLGRLVVERNMKAQTLSCWPTDQQAVDSKFNLWWAMCSFSLGNWTLQNADPSFLKRSSISDHRLRQRPLNLQMKESWEKVKFKVELSIFEGTKGVVGYGSCNTLNSHASQSTVRLRRGRSLAKQGLRRYRE